MKRILFALLITMIFVSCQKDSENVSQPKTGQYLYTDNTYTVAVGVYENKKSCSITVFENGKYVWQDVRSDKNLSGDWPTYIFAYSSYYLQSGEIVLNCTYNSNSEFLATVQENTTEINLPASMTFKYDNRVLDKNGDGILDELQPEYSGKKAKQIFSK